MSKLKMAVLVGLSLAIGAIGYFKSSHESATLTIQAKTLETGERSIYLEDGDAKPAARIPFQINSAEGNTTAYIVELPRINFKSIRIPPLAGVGRYEIERITLANHSISYQWDQNLNCTQRYQQGAATRAAACAVDSPKVAVDRDYSIRIASIPATGFSNPVSYRLAIAFSLGLIVLLFGYYLLKPASELPWPGVVRQYSVRVAWLMVLLLYAYQLYLLRKYALDLPYYEEWEFFDASALPRGMSWQWLSQQVSHQRMMIFTKLMAWLNFKLFSLDFVKLKIMNYAVFGCLLLAVIRFKRRVIGDDFPFFPLFMLFLLSPIVYEIHAASFQGGETFSVLCSVLMLSFAFRKEPSYKASLAFSLCAIASMYSLSAGVVYALLYLLCDTLYTAVNQHKKRIDARAGLRTLIVRWAIVLPAIVIWFHGMKKPETTTWVVPELLLPNETKFWDVFLNLLGFGFGFQAESPLPGIICAVILLAPICYLLSRAETRWEQRTWQLIAAIIGSLGVVALITIGRGNMGFSIKVSRYAIFGMLLIPYGAMAWWSALHTHTWRLRGLAILWCLLAMAYYNDWDYGVYRDIRPQEIMNLGCVERYSSGTGNGLCPESFVQPIGTYLDNAKALDVHFTRQFAAPAGGR